jgi:hypothetical protein
MTNDTADAFTRIDRALERIERVARNRVPAAVNDDSERRFQRLRTRTQAALAELDTVIARVGKGGQG